MKKLTALLVVFALTVACSISSSAEVVFLGKEGSLSKDECFTQLAENKAVTELYYPEIEGESNLRPIRIKIDASGSYYYDYACISSKHPGLFIFSIGFANRDVVNPSVAPFVSLMKANGAEDPFDTSKEAAACIKDIRSVTEYTDKPIISFGENYEDQRVDGYEIYRAYQLHQLCEGTYDDGVTEMVPYIDVGATATVYGSYFNVIIPVSDTYVMSILCNYSGDQATKRGLEIPEDWWKDLEKSVMAEIFSPAKTARGDANGDGKVNAVDALDVLKDSVGKKKIEDPLARQLCDMNFDEELTAADALLVLAKAVGK